MLRALAVLAMLVQVVFFAEHLGASAVHAMGSVTPGERLGFLQICTGEGIALYDPATGKMVTAPGQSLPSPTSHGDCAVCSSAGVCSFDAPTGAVAPTPNFTLQAVAETALFIPFDIIAAPRRSGLIRAPPAA
ncbi:hypothetical protein [Rhodobacter sp. JA431]|uniref:hypothetical protein n=1 Tax=Rhodobacter sp. JA431 TaxID=570013 RepID=UPI0014821C49|nr:hypothetical protein [Rhodobacter sp. JA431]